MKKMYKSKNLITGTWKAKVFYVCVIILPMLQFLTFYFGVLVNSVLLSFKEYDMKTGEYVFGGGAYNYRLFFSELKSPSSNLGQMFVNSGIVWLASTMLGITLALFFAFYITKKMAGSGFFKLMLFLPTIVSTIAMALIYRRFTDRLLYSFFNDVFHYDFGKPFAGKPNEQFTACVIYTLIMGFGTQVLMYTGVMSRIPTSVVEYATLDGINAFQEFFIITLPLVYPTISTFLVAGVGGFFINQAGMYDFFGSKAEQSIQTLGYFMYNKTAGDGAVLSDYPKMSAFGVIFTLIAVPVTLLARWGLEKLSPNVEY
ncbi:MAG: sugar ABC transporter permease [Clostridia bacterium]|nr:sugar ABC transporter permease [Clostridia bacterium]